MEMKCHNKAADKWNICKVIIATSTNSDRFDTAISNEWNMEINCILFERRKMFEYILKEKKGESEGEREGEKTYEN